MGMMTLRGEAIGLRWAVSDDAGQDHAAASRSAHLPVMLDTVLSLLAPQPGQTVLDCTIGRGGHAGALMPRLAPDGRYIGIDVDPANLDAVRAAFPEPPVRLDLWRGNFADARSALDELGVERVDGLLADLGFASDQLEDPGRGLSFSREGPLDMRLDPSLEETAAELVHRLPERELADMLWRFGEERLSRRIARKIVERRRHRPISTTAQLAELCREAYGPRAARQRIDPATRTFQALRIAVNDELGRLRTLLERLPDLLSSAGRAVIISFHSLEDRLVKHTLREMARSGAAELLTRKPITATEAERAANPRARSAKCRAIRMIDPGAAQ